jgi:hypothetical protein
MIEVTSQDANGIPRIGLQPIGLAVGTLVVILLGIGSIALWRAYTGTSPEQDRIVAARQLQVRAAQASEQLVEKTKGLEATQQESIDQLQVVQDQLQAVKRLLAAQQADAKRLSDQVAGLTEAIDRLAPPRVAINRSEQGRLRQRVRIVSTPSRGVDGINPVCRNLRAWAAVSPQRNLPGASACVAAAVGFNLSSDLEMR